MNASLLLCLERQLPAGDHPMPWNSMGISRPPQHHAVECASFRDKETLGPNLVLWNGRSHVLGLSLKTDADWDRP